MQITVLAAVIINLVLLGFDGLEGLMPPGWQTAPALAAYLLGAVGIAAANTALGLRAIGRAGAAEPKALRRHNLIALATSLWLILGLATTIYLGFGRWVMKDLHLAGVPLAGQLMSLVPFVAALLAAWVIDYPFYRLMRERALAARPDAARARRPWTPRQYISYNCRHHLLFVLVPVSLIVLAQDSLHLYAWPHLSGVAGGDYVMLAALAASALAVVFFAPVLIVRIWKTEPLRDKPLRQGLEEIRRLLKLRYRDILVWKSEGMIANAGVMGLAGNVRYVLLSDGLLENADHRQVEAVFAHEAGHIASHHIFYSAMFAIASAALCNLAAIAISKQMHLTDLHETALTLALLAPAWGLGFGWISRRFERQSDVIGAWAIGSTAGADPPQGPQDRKPPADEGCITPEGAAIFATALENIARLNGIPARQRSWRHGSIAGRISYILWLGSRRGSRRSIDRVVRRVKLAIWLLLACAVALMVTLSPAAGAAKAILP